MESNYFDGAAGKLHYLSYSPASSSKPVMLFLGGMTTHAHYWDEIAPAFSSGYSVYALDWRGHGDSAAASTYGYQDYLDDLNRTLSKLGHSPQTVLVGHSLGGYVALLYASQPQNTNLLAGVVAADVKTSSTEQEHEGGRRSAAKPQAAFATLEEVAARLKAAMPDGSVSEQRLLEIARDGTRQQADGTYVLKYDRKLLDFEPVEPFKFVSNIAVPTLIINGERSNVMNNAQATMLANAIPGALHVEIKGAGHHVFLDKPQEFIKAIQNFLAI